jgi:hypothetical protein
VAVLFIPILIWMFMLGTAYGLKWAGRRPPITTSIPFCAACAYPLVGLDTAASCPECGSSRRTTAAGHDHKHGHRAPNWALPLAALCCLLALAPGACIWTLPRYAGGYHPLVALALLLHAALSVAALWLTADRAERWPFLASLAVLAGGTFALNSWVLTDAVLPPTGTSPDQAEIDGIFGAIGPLVAPMFAAAVFVVAGIITAAVYDARQSMRRVRTSTR